MGLPQPTRDRARASQDLAEHGYCVWENALEPHQLAALRERLVEQAAGEDAVGRGFHDGQANQRLWMLVNKGLVFRDLVMHPAATDFMGELLGPDFLLSSLTANIARPGGVPMYLHTDQGYVDFWTDRPVVANMAWMLDDFTDLNGGTRLVPGSHLRPAAQYTAQDTIAAEGPAGSALIFDGRLYHGTGENRSEGSQRHAILSYFCRPFVRQQENFFLGLDRTVRRAEREGFLRRLGFSIWAGLGRTDAPGDRGLQSPLDRPEGPLDGAGEPKLEVSLQFA
jgi:ectoine hydroxylase-related dioxygenase (phytanoyl-CoA dioxygenase family)